MTRRKGKRAVKQAVVSDGNATTVDEKGPEMKNKGGSSTDREVERQVAAIKAISDMEVEHLLTGLRLIRSYFNEDQLQTPVLKFFKEYLPNVSVVRDSEGEHFDLRWKEEDGNLPLYNVDGGDIHASLFHRMSMAYPSCSDVRQSFGGHQFSERTVKSHGVADDLQIGNYMSQETRNTLMLGIPEGFHTPGPSSQRLSVGMTPKTVRLPKHGEMLLSVHGSPLGVYKEDNMEAIHESEEG